MTSACGIGKPPLRAISSGGMNVFKNMPEEAHSFGSHHNP
jgi:hypothetical protein